MSDKSIITVAKGKKYLDFAYALARSFKYHNPNSDISFHVISSEDFKLPKDLSWVAKLIVSPQTLGEGVAFKFKFNEIIPSKYCVFIDSDSLIYDDLSSCFTLFGSSCFSVIGTKINTGNWVDLDIEATCKKYGTQSIIRYCGALYYITQSIETHNLFQVIEKIYSDNTDHQFQKHGTGINEEPVFSIAMSLNNINPIVDDGNIWGDIVQFSDEIDLNVFNGLPIFKNMRGNKFKFWLPDGEYSPKVIHFGGGIHNKNPWIFESIRLKLYSKTRLPQYMINLIVNILIKQPYFLLKSLAGLLQ